jgi:hypothetical protein
VERDGRREIGTAVAGATAKRLGADSGIGETMTVATRAVAWVLMSGR